MLGLCFCIREGGLSSLHACLKRQDGTRPMSPIRLRDYISTTRLIMCVGPVLWSLSFLGLIESAGPYQGPTLLTWSLGDLMHESVVAMCDVSSHATGVSTCERALHSGSRKYASRIVDVLARSFAQRSGHISDYCFRSWSADRSWHTKTISFVLV